MWIHDEAGDMSRTQIKRSASAATASTCTLGNFLLMGMQTDFLAIVMPFINMTQANEFDAAQICRRFRDLKSKLEIVFVKGWLLLAGDEQKNTYTWHVIEQLKQRPKFVLKERLVVMGDAWDCKCLVRLPLSG